MPSNGSTPRRVLIAVPALNEQETLPSVIHEIRTAYAEGDVLIVDDGSTDETSEVARAAGAKVCRLPFNLGVGGAMRTAFKYAEREGYDVVVQVDADGQHDAADIRRLVDGLDSADVVLGSRFAGDGEYRVDTARRSAMRLLAFLLSRLADVRLTDVTSGFRASNSRAISIFALHYPSEYLGDTVESLVIALRTGCTVTQIPVRMRMRAYGRPSQTSLLALVYLSRATLALLFALVRQWPAPAPAVDWGAQGLAVKQLS